MMRINIQIQFQSYKLNFFSINSTLEKYNLEYINILFLNLLFWIHFLNCFLHFKISVNKLSIEVNNINNIYKYYK